jgi:hypothetical protein
VHRQLATELPERDGLRGLVVSASNEIEPGARAMLVLAEGLFRIDVVVHGDSLRTVVRNFTDRPLEVTQGTPGINLAFGEVAVLRPGRADLEFTLGAGADRLRARVTMATLRFDERGTVRVSANAVLRQDPGLARAAAGGRAG